MKPKYYIIITVVLVVMILTGVYIGINYRKIGYEECGDVVLSGYLVTDCIWEIIPTLPDVKSTLYAAGSLCRLDIWLSENETASPETCEKIPLTSKCFLEKVSLFDPWNLGRENFFRPKVTLIGKYEKIKVCDLLYKGIGPAERGAKCDKKNVFVPCELKIDETQVIKDPKLKYQQILYNPKSKYCEVDEDCDIASEPACCVCPEIFNKEYAEKINQLPRPDCDPKISCKYCYYWTACKGRECIKCVNNACKIVFPKKD